MFSGELPGPPWPCWGRVYVEGSRFHVLQCFHRRARGAIPAVWYIRWSESLCRHSCCGTMCRMSSHRPPPMRYQHIRWNYVSLLRGWHMRCCHYLFLMMVIDPQKRFLKWFAWSSFLGFNEREMIISIGRKIIWMLYLQKTILLCVL